MSKRSYRRLTVVAGAALAVGSMAPALAARVEADGSATVDAPEATVPSAGSLVPTGLISDAGGTAVGTVQDARALVLADVAHLRSAATGLAGDVLGAASGVSADADANANASSGGASVEVSGLVGGVDGVQALVPAPADAVGEAAFLAAPLAGTAFGLAGTAGGLAGAAPGIVAGTAGGLLGTGLGLLDGVSASGEVNVVASLLGSL